MENSKIVSLYQNTDFHSSPCQLWTARQGFYLVFSCIDAILASGSILSAAFISCDRFYALYWMFNHRSLSTRSCSIAWSYFGHSLSYCLQCLLCHRFLFTGTWFVCFYVRLVKSNNNQHRDLEKSSTRKSCLTASKQGSAKETLNNDFTFCIHAGFTLLASISYHEHFNLLYKDNNTLDVLLHCKHFFYSNSFVNPVVYALRIPEFPQALRSCCRRG